MSAHNGTDLEHRLRAVESNAEAAQPPKMHISVPTAIAVSVMEVAIAALNGGAQACRNVQHEQAAEMLASVAKQLAERGAEMVREEQKRIVVPKIEMPKGAGQA